MRLVGAAALGVGLLVVAGCGRSDPRIGKTEEALTWGSPGEDRVRDLLMAAVKRATNASLEKPELVSAEFRIPTKAGHGMVEVDWIGGKPGADGVRVILSGGGTVDMPIGAADRAENERTSATLLIYQGVIFAEKDFAGEWGKMVADKGAKAVLTLGGKAVSNEVGMVVEKIVPASRPAATEPAGKMVVTVDGAGKMSMYLLSKDVKAGEAFDPAEVYAASLDIQAGFAGALTDARGPAAFKGMRFAADHSQNEMLDTSMFGGAATVPATGK